MKLIIDIGNTFSKIAVFKEDEMVFLESYSSLSIQEVSKIEEKYPDLKAVIVSTVIIFCDELRSYFQNKYPFVELSSKTRLPIKSNYKTPETLGKDRIAAVVAGHHLYPNTDVLVIDAGTCITYDLISKDGIYQGGSISPGINMRFKALNNYTANLPLLEFEEIDYLSGTTTNESILSGIINGVSLEIDGIINSYRNNYENLTIILSGGDYIYFDKRLKNNIFALPNIVLRGLNIILDFNGKKLD